MLFIIYNTGSGIYWSLDSEYVNKLKVNNFKIKPFCQKIEHLKEYTIYSIELETIDDIIRLKEVVERELIFRNTYDFEEIKVPQIEIYDDYIE